MKKIYLTAFALLACMSLFAAETVKIGDLYYKIYTSSVYAEVIADQSGQDPKYGGLTELGLEMENNR